MPAAVVFVTKTQRVHMRSMKDQLAHIWEALEFVLAKGLNKLQAQYITIRLIKIVGFTRSRFSKQLKMIGMSYLKSGRRSQLSISHNSLERTSYSKNILIFSIISYSIIRSKNKNFKQRWRQVWVQWLTVQVWPTTSSSHILNLI